MSVYLSNITPRERSKARAYGAGLATVGMLSYYLPVTKGRYVENAFSVVQNQTLDDVDLLNQAALSLTKNNKIKPEQKLFLSQLGVGEDIVSINGKIAQLKDSITDSVTIKNLKQGFADSFDACKKDVVLRDSVSMKAFNKIRWTNFMWGTALGMLLGYGYGLIKANDSKNSYFG